MKTQDILRRDLEMLEKLADCTNQEWVMTESERSFGREVVYLTHLGRGHSEDTQPPLSIRVVYGTDPENDKGRVDQYELYLYGSQLNPHIGGDYASLKELFTPLRDLIATFTTLGSFADEPGEV